MMRRLAMVCVLGLAVNSVWARFNVYKSELTVAMDCDRPAGGYVVHRFQEDTVSRRPRDGE